MESNDAFLCNTHMGRGRARARVKQRETEREATALSSKAQKLSKYLHFGRINAVLLVKIRLYTKANAERVNFVLTFV